MKKTYSVLLTLIMVTGFISGFGNAVYSQQKDKGYIITEKLVIGKKYDGKIPDAAIARIDAKMDEIYALIKNSCIENDTIPLSLKFIKDVNNLKSIEMVPPMQPDPEKDVNTLVQLKILKKTPISMSWLR